MFNSQNFCSLFTAIEWLKSPPMLWPSMTIFEYAGSGRPSFGEPERSCSACCKVSRRPAAAIGKGMPVGYM